MKVNRKVVEKREFWLWSRQAWQPCAKVRTTCTGARWAGACARCGGVSPAPAARRPSSTRCAAPSLTLSRRIHLRLLVTAPCVSRITRREFDLRDPCLSISLRVRHNRRLPCHPAA